MTSRCYVVLLNWRGWKDTIACLETLFASEGQSMRVVVCDNNSGDGSLDYIERWASGDLAPETPKHPRLARLLGKLRGRPVCQRVSRAAAEAGLIDAHADLLLVDNEANLGFAAGNNVGLRLALSQPDMDSVWVLNNDTLVEPHCLSRMRNELRQRGDRAVCGSMIHFMDRPEILQAIAGNRFNHRTGTAACSEGRFIHEDDVSKIEERVAGLAYVSGCSMLLPRAFLEEVGLMSEDYFLYYEEIDWFTRARGRFPICVAPTARIFHKEGSAIGSPGWERPASAFADFHLYRSRLIFMKKFFWWNLPWCYANALMEVSKCIFKGRFKHAATVMSVLFQSPEAPVPGS